MFTPEQRQRTMDLLVQRAQEDPRIVAAAATGGSAIGEDRWSDIDLGLAVREGDVVDTVLDDWTHTLTADLGAATLFDLPFMSSIYRVFLLPGALQVDLSFTPASEFGALGPRFRLLFGEAVDRPRAPGQAPDRVFGMGVHHAVRAHICIERGRLWQAEYWVHGLRDQALSLACLNHGLEVSHGRGFDGLPTEVIGPFEGALVKTLSVEELRRALAVATAGLLQYANGSASEAALVRPMLQDLLLPIQGAPGGRRDTRRDPAAQGRE